MFNRNERVCKATPNHSKKTFTLRIEGKKYRTDSMSKQEFNESLHMSSGDWVYFLRGSQYSIVK